MDEKIKKHINRCDKFFDIIVKYIKTNESTINKLTELISRLKKFNTNEIKINEAKINELVNIIEELTLSFGYSVNLSYEVMLKVSHSYEKINYRKFKIKSDLLLISIFNENDKLSIINNISDEQYIDKINSLNFPLLETDNIYEENFYIPTSNFCKEIPKNKIIQNLNLLKNTKMIYFDTSFIEKKIYLQTGGINKNIIKHTKLLKENINDIVLQDDSNKSESNTIYESIDKFVSRELIDNIFTKSYNTMLDMQKMHSLYIKSFKMLNVVLTEADMKVKVNNIPKIGEILLKYENVAKKNTGKKIMLKILSDIFIIPKYNSAEQLICLSLGIFDFVKDFSTDNISINKLKYKLYDKKNIPLLNSINTGIIYK